MTNFYNDYFVVPQDKAASFEEDKKHNLSRVEKLGLEAVLDSFVSEYEEDNFGEPRSIKDYIRWNDDNVDILDGVIDTYVFDHYAIGSVWTTTSGCICMDAVDLDEYEGDDEEAFESSDLFDRPYNFDIWSEFKPVLIRLW